MPNRPVVALRLVRVAVLGLLLAMVPGTGEAVAAARDDRVEALYVQNASRGTFDGQRLKLFGVAPVVSWFADRPQRSSGLLTMHQALGELFGPGQPAPNAALDLTRDEVSGVLALKLRAPRYDRRRHVLSYRVRRLRTLRNTKLAHLDGQRRRARIPRRFDAASLFLDDGQPPAAQPLEQFTAANFPSAVLDRSASELVVVAFTAEWASPSRAYIPALNTVATQRAASAAVGVVDLDSDNAGDLSGTYAISSIPTTLVFRNGQVVDRWVGVASASAVEQRLDQLQP